MKQELQSICGRVKLKKDSFSRVKEWANELNKRKEEGLNTLKDEGVYIEAVFFEKAVDGDYLIYFMKLRSLEEASKVARNSKHPIDEYHKQFQKDCWESTQDLELLVDLDRYADLFNE